MRVPERDYLSFLEERLVLLRGLAPECYVTMVFESHKAQKVDHLPTNDRLKATKDGGLGHFLRKVGINRSVINWQHLLKMWLLREVKCSGSSWTC